jgi:phospholipid transport system substrate-binding protein
METRPKKTRRLEGPLAAKYGNSFPADNICHRGTTMTLTKRQLLATITLMAASVFASWAHAEDEAPDALIKRLSVDVLDSIKSDKAIRAGDVDRVIALVDTRIMPNVNFQRMTASAVGPAWRQATPEQQKRLQDEFKILLVRTYAGALAEVSDQTISMKPFRASSDDKEVVVRTEVRGRGDPIQLDYRLEKTPGVGAGWKIYNLNVLGVWLVETYRSQFAQQINAKGIDGLINALVDQNKANAKKA